MSGLLDVQLDAVTQRQDAAGADLDRLTGRQEFLRARLGADECSAVGRVEVGGPHHPTFDGHLEVRTADVVARAGTVSSLGMSVAATRLAVGERPIRTVRSTSTGSPVVGRRMIRGAPC